MGQLLLDNIIFGLFQLMHAITTIVDSIHSAHSYWMAYIILSLLSLLLFWAARTDVYKMYRLISALHALCNDTMLANDMYVGKCQDSSNFNKELIQGNLLICSYSIRFVLGLSTIKQALETAKNLSASGVVFYMDPFVIGFQLNPTPLEMPGIIIPSPDDSKVQLLHTFSWRHMPIIFLISQHLVSLFLISYSGKVV